MFSILIYATLIIPWVVLIAFVVMFRSIKIDIEGLETAVFVLQNETKLLGGEVILHYKKIEALEEKKPCCD